MSVTSRSRLPHRLLVLLDDGLLPTLVDQANTASREIDAGGLPVLEAIIVQADVAFGVWQDEHERGGVGVLILKGTARPTHILSTKPADTLKISSIACRDLEQAKELHSVFGDGALQ